MKTALTIIGTLLFLTGVIWFFQGIGVIQGSLMTGTSTWTIIGAVCVIIGIGMIVFVRRPRPAA